MTADSRGARRIGRLLDIQRLIRLAPVQERFGPSLPELIAPRIDRLPGIARRVAAVIGVIAIAVVVALVLRTRDAVYSCPGPAVTCSIPYPHSLTREPTPHGAMLLLEQRSSAGLIASFEVTPLHLPSYSGEISGLLPVIAINYERRLAAATPSFQPWSLGRTRIINTPAFTFTYSFYRAGPDGPQTQYYGRVVFITAKLSGDRSGLILTLVQLPKTLFPATDPAQPTPDAVGAAGSLQDPLQHLRIG